MIWAKIFLKYFEIAQKLNLKKKLLNTNSKRNGFYFPKMIDFHVLIATAYLLTYTYISIFSLVTSVTEVPLLQKKAKYLEIEIVKNVKSRQVVNWLPAGT